MAARRRAATWRWISVNTCLELASSASQSRRGRQAVWRPCGVTAITSTHLESVYVDTTNCTVHLLPPGCSPVPSAIKGHSPPSDAPIAPGALPWPPPRRPSTPNFNGRAGFNRTPAPSSSGHHRCTCHQKTCPEPLRGPPAATRRQRRRASASPAAARASSQPLLLLTAWGIWRRLRRGWAVKVPEAECPRGARWNGGSVRCAKANQRPDGKSSGSFCQVCCDRNQAGKEDCALVAPSGLGRGRWRWTVTWTDRSPLK